MTDRLTVVDEIFLRTHRGMGTPIALQGLWRIDEAMEPALLQAIHDRLRVGSLGRRVVRARVPGARRGWRPTVSAHPLVIAGTPLSEDAILPWADTLGADLDPEFGPGWRLSAAPLRDGGTVVALTCSHALADARGLIHAVAVALDELDRHQCAIPPSETGRPTSPSDWADALSQWSIVLGETARALRRGIPRPPATTVPDNAADRAVHSILLAFDAIAWDSAAAAAGGTPNSLFIHLVANILWESGFQPPIIEASLPVDTRDEPRVDNDLAVTDIAIDRTDTPATIRDKARIAYQRRMSSPAGLPEEILQVIPDRWAYSLSKGAGERDILCSNIGTLPESLRTVGPHHCDRVAARAIHPGLTEFPRTRLSGYLSLLTDRYTLALVSLERDRETLLTATDRVCSTAGLRAQAW
ncbi:hypothetical protein FEK33_05885 [Nocardia asteroides NBRC 15531]|uniref:Condensation domain-containing protein n=1 Tax=Nocardia asteroides NBRC 15531 TaxID=1110697 RepID=U5E494_NOCAS|nr:hypothetical protein [Nocardia asteroides]TLF69799.1 hypothetical protein FEK33_05885 [Nocardia asteroides NBRC 15531]UGT49303.1 hypothetical protein LT345_01360 [Nocardia asteroides]SFL86213.1 hypothetical protein SAMN05444423_1011191 [Nocardia asteroides]VEG38303.1 Uncharacterised protein [Nocardia asteroides]GAD83887.1 hypothetical protein NCAST_20_04570 [Nocardia asteroides NBRC 15531]